MATNFWTKDSALDTATVAAADVDAVVAALSDPTVSRRSGGPRPAIAPAGAIGALARIGAGLFSAVESSSSVLGLFQSADIAGRGAFDVNIQNLTSVTIVPYTYDTDNMSAKDMSLPIAPGETGNFSFNRAKALDTDSQVSITLLMDGNQVMLRPSLNNGLWATKVSVNGGDSDTFSTGGELAGIGFPANSQSSRFFSLYWLPIEPDNGVMNYLFVDTTESNWNS